MVDEGDAMSLVRCEEQGPGDADGPRDHRKALHRVAAVRRAQGMSRRTIARKLRLDLATVRLHELPSTDLLLSELYQWQQALEVPIAELLVDSEEPLAAPVLRRAQMVRIMKTALAISENAHQVSVRRMAQTLVEQLKELMPELAHVTPWHSVGKRRRRDEFGVAAERHFPERIFFERPE